MPPLERDCRECLAAGECTVAIIDGSPVCPRFPGRVGNVCGSCAHLVPGKFIDPSPLPNGPTVYGCELRDACVGVHAQTRACREWARKHDTDAGLSR